MIRKRRMARRGSDGEPVFSAADGRLDFAADVGGQLHAPE
jgi:hypothetical protein